MVRTPNMPNAYANKDLHVIFPGYTDKGNQL